MLYHELQQREKMLQSLDPEPTDGILMKVKLHDKVFTRRFKINESVQVCVMLSVCFKHFVIVEGSGCHNCTPTFITDCIPNCISLIVLTVIIGTGRLVATPLWPSVVMFTADFNVSFGFLSSHISQ